MRKYIFLANLVFLFLFFSFSKPVYAHVFETDESDIQTEREQEESYLSELELSRLDDWLEEQDEPITFSKLVRKIIQDGFQIDFTQIGDQLYQAVLGDYIQNRKMLMQILALILSFSFILQISSVMSKKYLSSISFLGVYLLLMLLLLKIFSLMSHTIQGYLEKLVEFMQLLQPVFCLSMLFSTGSMSAGVSAELLFLAICLVDLVFMKILFPMVQIHFILQLVNHMMEEKRFSKIAMLLSEGLSQMIRILVVFVSGLNMVQGLLAPSIDRVRRGSVTGAVRLIPGAGQLVNSMSELLAGSALLVKNSVGTAGMLILLIISLLPLLKIFIFMWLYKICAAIVEPVTDKRICGAVSALGQSAELYLKLMFYAMVLFFLTLAILCTMTLK